MAKYPGTSVQINDHLWVYLEPEGICVVTPGKIIGHIPWKTVLKAADLRRSIVAKHKPKKRRPHSKHG